MPDVHVLEAVREERLSDIIRTFGQGQPEQANFVKKTKTK